VLLIVEFRFVLRSDFFALPNPLSIIAVRYSRTPAIFVAPAKSRFSSADARTNQLQKPCSGAFTIGYY
jgi:hypothetical protein